MFSFLIRATESMKTCKDFMLLCTDQRHHAKFIGKLVLKTTKSGIRLILMQEGRGREGSRKRGQSTFTSVDTTSSHKP